ncbi:MAG: hypothetical protein Q9M26_00505 [Mariprofundales bacterium]|nr:hypothetical protein [Mariprofundales bacterium]
MKCWILGCLALLIPLSTLADPLDRGEGYTTRPGPPPWMDGVDFAWLLVDYALFAIVIGAVGWMLMRKPAICTRIENAICLPFRTLLNLADYLPIGLRELAQGLVYVAILLFVVLWIFFCQWFNHHGFGGLAMIGLALESTLLVRLIGRDSHP